MLAGQPPFTGLTPQAILSAQITQAPEDVTRHRASIPAPVATLVMRCLAKNPADRWQRAEDIVRELDAMPRPGTGTTRSGASPRLSRRRQVAVVVAGAAIVAALGYVWSSGLLKWRSHQAHLPIVAVLPFENLGAAGDEYFADGMTDELTGRLTRVPGLRVIARTSVMQYRRTSKSIPQIARELGADFLIEGTVRWEKRPNGTSVVRIAPQVVRASDGTQVWAEHFDKPYGTGIFETQSEIAERVTVAMSGDLTADEPKTIQVLPTKNLEAYDLYLRGRALSRGVVGQNWDAERQALELLEKAVQLDPLFAQAHAELAAVQLRMVGTGYDMSLPSGVQPQQRAERARASATRALAIDPDLTTAHLILTGYHVMVSRDTTRARDEIELAMRGNPNDADVIFTHALWLNASGRVAEGLRELQRVVVLDPRNPGPLMYAAWGIRQHPRLRTCRGLLRPGDCRGAR